MCKSGRILVKQTETSTWCALLYWIGNWSAILDIFYGLSKLMYGEWRNAYTIYAMLHSCLLVYRLWHVYKYSVLATYQALWPIVAYLRFVIVPLEHKQPAHPKPIVLENFCGSMHGEQW